MAGWWIMARPRDDLGLGRALGERMLPLIVAAMSFLAALALAGSVGAAALAQRWQEGAASVLSVQVPKPTTPSLDQPAQSRLERVLAVLRGTPGIGTARPLSEAELTELLKPWLGSGAGRLALPLPAVIEVHLTGAGPDMAGLSQRLEATAPGTTPESHGVWVRRLSALARSLEACAWVALALVAGIAAAMIAIATRAGLAVRRDAIEIVHGLGATDAIIAGRFAARATRNTAGGALLGALVALPVLLVLTDLAAPFATVGAQPATAAIPWIGALPTALWVALAGLPVVAALIGWTTTQITVRRWLRQLP